MTDLDQTPEEELLEALSNLTDEAILYDDWFVKRFPIEDSFLDIFDAPHIDWNKIAPKSKLSHQYRDLFSVMNRLYGDEFRKIEYNGHISFEDVRKDGSWRNIPKLARALKLCVETELAERIKNKF